MMITAQNKMGSARVVWQNYSEYMLQTTAFRLTDRAWLEANLDAGRQLLAEIGDPNHATSTRTRPVWSGVPWQTVDAFLSRYRFDPRGSHDMNAIRQYLQLQIDQDELVEWVIAIPGLAATDNRLGIEPLLSVRGSPANRISRTRLRNKPYDIGTLVNPATLGNSPGSGDEEVGLTADQLAAAGAGVDEAGSFPRALRRQRNPREGVLLLYPISPESRPRAGTQSRVPLFDDPARDGLTVLGIALVFPHSVSDVAIEYVVGSVGGEGGAA